MKKSKIFSPEKTVSRGTGLFWHMSSPIPEKAFPLLLAGVTLLGFLIRLFLCSCSGDLDRDSILYINIAREYHTTGQYPGIMLPFLGTVMKHLHHLGLGLETGGLAVNLLLSTLLIPLVYGILRQFCAGKEIPLCGAILTAFHPTLLELSVKILRDSPYLFFSGIALFFCFSAMKGAPIKSFPKRALFWAGAGGSLALGVCCRHEILELLSIGGFYFVFAAFKKRERLRELAGEMASFLFAFLLVLSLFLLIHGFGEDFLQLYGERFLRIWKERN